MFKLLDRDSHHEKTEADSVLLPRHAHLIFKHSPYCVVSAVAHREISQLSTLATSLPVSIVDVFRQRVLSDEIASRTQIRHESPQVLLLRDARVVWHASHGAITAVAIVKALEALPGRTTGRDDG